MNKYIISLIFLTLFSSVFSQNSKIDSLLSLLSNQMEDTNKVRTYEQILKKYYRPNPVKAIEYGKIGLKLAQKLNDNKGISNLSNNVGIINYKQGNYTEALNFYNISLDAAILLHDTLSISKSYTNIGVIYYAIGAYDEAVQYYSKSYKLKENLNDSIGMAKITNNIGTILYEKGDFAEAQKNYLISLKIKEKLGASDAAAQTLINIGNIYEKQNNFEKAIEFYEKALSKYKITDNSNGMANAYSQIASSNSNMKKYTKAINYYKKARVLSEKTKNKSQIVVLTGNIASIYNDRKQYDKSLEFYNKALEIAIEAKLEKKQIVLNTEIAKVYNKFKKPNKTIEYLKKAEQVSNKKLTLNEKRHLYETYFVAYALLKDAEKADFYVTRYQQVHDSLFSEKNSKALSDMQVKYDTEKKQQEIEILTKDNKIKEQAEEVQQFKIRLLLLGLIAMVVLVAVALYSFYVKKKANIALHKINIQLNQHKEEITSQNEELLLHKEEIQKQHDRIFKQHEIVVEQKQHITNSIIYAQRIQQAALPEESIMNKIFTEHFVYFKPRDIVSGDFYWVKEIIRDNKTYKLFAVADCTGHGVPGAFVSMLGISILNELVRRPNIMSVAQLLDELRLALKLALKQKSVGGSSKDGMDIVIAIMDVEYETLQVAGAYNPLYIIREEKDFDEKDFIENNRVKLYSNNEISQKQLIEVKVNRQPIGVYRKEKPFVNTYIRMKENDYIYMFSDGFTDQFNDITGEKFKNKRFKNMLLSASEKNISEQKDFINETFISWKGNREQIDDILILGAKI